jgi:steroid delta-isomerase-like uncharacterized protein
MKLGAIAVACLCAGLLTTHASSSLAEVTMTKDQVQTYVAIFESAINKGDATAVEALLAPSLVDHAPWPGQTADMAGFKAGLAGMKQSFPDLNVKVERTVAEGDLLSVQFQISGTQLGSFMGAPASGKTFKVEAMDIVRLSNGRVVEHWGVFDAAGMMGQLGR